jgi:hypothetical protein
MLFAEWTLITCPWQHVRPKRPECRIFLLSLLQVGNFKPVSLNKTEICFATKRMVFHSNLLSVLLCCVTGASPNLWANDWKLFHGLLYAQSKGKAEEAVKSAGFAYVTIMRPGLLQRGTLARGMEPIAAKIIPSIPVSHVAAAMIADSLAFHDGKKQGETLKVFEMKEMQNYAKEIMKNSNGG